MVIIHDNGSVVVQVADVNTPIVPANVLTPAERDAMRAIVDKLRTAGRAVARAALASKIEEIDRGVDGAPVVTPAREPEPVNR